MCNLKVSAAAQTTGHAPEGGGYISTGGDTHRKMDMGNGQPIRLIKITTSTTTSFRMGMIPGNPIPIQNARRRNTDTRMKQCVAT